MYNSLKQFEELPPEIQQVCLQYAEKMAAKFGQYYLESLDTDDNNKPKYVSIENRSDSTSSFSIDSPTGLKMVLELINKQAALYDGEMSIESHDGEESDSITEVYNAEQEQESKDPATIASFFSVSKVTDLLNGALPDKKIDEILPDGVERNQVTLVVTVIGCVLDTTSKREIPLIRYQDSFFIFNGQYYVRIEPDDLKEFLGVSAMKMGVSHFTGLHYGFRDQLLKQFQSQAYFPAPAVKPEEVFVNLQNGTLVVTPERTYLAPHDASRSLFYVLPYNFDANATAPKWLQFLDEVLPDKSAQMVLAEFVASSFLSPKVLKIEKALILFGAGANGKSVVFEVLSEVLGKNNISHYSLSSLCDEKGYHRAELTGKRINWATEISTRMNTAVFKALASREPIEARRPHCNAFIQEEIPPLVFNTNVLPRDVEQNTGFFRRFLIIRFPNSIPPEKRNPRLAQEIIETELPGVLNWLLVGLSRLIAQKGLTHSDSIEYALNEFRKTSCSVSLFIEDIGMQPSTVKTESLKEVFKSYRNFCNENGLIAVSVKTFSERLGEYGFTVHRRSHGRIVFSNYSH